MQGTADAAEDTVTADAGGGESGSVYCPVSCSCQLVGSCRTALPHKLLAVIANTRCK